MQRGSTNVHSCHQLSFGESQQIGHNRHSPSLDPRTSQTRVCHQTNSIDSDIHRVQMPCLSHCNRHTHTASPTASLLPPTNTKMALTMTTRQTAHVI